MGRIATPKPSLYSPFWVIVLPDGTLKTSTQRANRCQPVLYRSYGLAVRVARNLTGAYVYEVGLEVKMLTEEDFSLVKPNKHGRYDATDLARKMR